MFFDTWEDLGRILVVGAIGYACVVAILRVTGKRTLSKMNAFDLIVTVALGSTLASMLLTETVSLSEGVLAIALLCLLQYAVTWASVRSDSFQKLVKAEPALLVSRGRMLEDALRRERFTSEEILAALRAAGLAGPEDAAAVILETDGSLSVIPTGGHDRFGALRTVKGVGRLAGTSQD